MLMLINMNGKRLSNLIYEISKIQNLERIRYMTSHPIDFSEDLIEAHICLRKINAFDTFTSSKWLKQNIKKMNRKHTIKDYLKLIDKIKKANPSIKFSSDFIIG